MHFLNIISFIFIHLNILNSNAEFNSLKFWSERNNIMRKENNHLLGAKLILSPNEILVDNYLMRLKTKEIDDAFHGRNKFLPAKNFIEAREDIEKTDVFKIIKQMPKGAVLHAHGTAIVSDKWIYENVTFRDNLYICIQSEKISLHFFDVPKNDCNWQLLSEIRKGNETFAEEINSRIRKELSMITENPDVAYPDVDSSWIKFENIFDFVTSLLHYRPVFEDHFYQGLKELYEDNVTYLELRSSLSSLYDLNGTNYDSLHVIKLYEEIAERFITDHPGFLGVKIIYTSYRGMSREDLQKCINKTIELKKIYPEFLAGFDLIGQEDKGYSIIDRLDIIKPLIDHIRFFFHAGETVWYGLETDENLLDAVLLNTTRVGHGYALLKHPKVLNLMRTKKIAVEVCPISNQVLGLVEDMRNHPASALFAQDFPVVISNDDPGLWGAKGLSHDFYEAFMGMMSLKSGLKALKQLAINSFYYSSMNDSEKGTAYETWRLQWNEFIRKIIEQHNLSKEVYVKNRWF